MNAEHQNTHAQHGFISDRLGPSGAMSAEYRVCPVSGRTVMIAPQRSARPVALEHFTPHARDPDGRNSCPFCPGNEPLTPPPLLEFSGPKGWDLRVVPNKYPATGTDAFGYHEVVIEGRRHSADPLDLSEHQLAAVFRAYRERMRSLLSDPRIRSVAVFKNVGAEAGASLPHNHSQLIALPFVPESLQLELHYSEQFWVSNRRSVFAEMLEASDREVLCAHGFAAVCPYAPRFAAEVWVIPQRPRARFEEITDKECLGLARLLQAVLAAQDVTLRRPAYNWLIHSAPADLPYFRWHLEILPRTDRPAGFEWGTGIFINATPPEISAQRLRAALNTHQRKPSGPTRVE